MCLAPCLRSSYDINKDSEQNLLTPEGFLLAVRSVLRLRTGGTLWGGVPCSSFVWISRGSSGRSKDMPEGNGSLCSILGNVLLVRFILLSMIAISRGCHVVIEQPESSLMTRHPRVLALQEKMAQWSQVRFWMGLFGGISAKPTKLFGTASVS